MPARRACRRSGFQLIGIECEIGFRVNQALPPRAQPYSRDEVLAVASLHPTIEVVDSRYQDFRSLDRLQVLADNFSNGGLVYGAAASGWQGMDLAHPPIEVTADGKPFADCTGCAPAIRSGLLVELRQHVASKRGGVRPAPSSRPARIPAWCSPSRACRSAPITARSAASRCRSRA